MEKEKEMVLFEKEKREECGCRYWWDWSGPRKPWCHKEACEKLKALEKELWESQEQVRHLQMLIDKHNHQ